MAKRILLADDSVTAQNMGRKILNEAGYEVVTVNNGSAALKRITEQKPELIVLDVYMPGYTGLEVCQRIKEAADTSAIPVLLTVGKLEPFKAEEAKRVHADAFIVKPFEATELLTVLSKLEDKIAPQPVARTKAQAPARAAKTVAEPAAAAPAQRKQQADAAEWKNRLTIPARSQESVPEKPASTAFHDLRRGQTPQPTPEEPAFDVTLPPDITSEEIAAITAAAASLAGAQVDAREAEIETVVPEASIEMAAPPAPVPEAPAIAVQAYAGDQHESYEMAPVAEVQPVYEPEVHPYVEAVHAEAAAAADEPANTFAAAPVAQSEAAPEIHPEFAMPPQEIPHEPVSSQEMGSAVQESTEAAFAIEAAAAASAQSSSDEAARLSELEVAAALASLGPTDGIAAGTASEPLGAAEAAAPASSLVENLYSYKWIAQEMPLEEGVSALILEREMQKVYAALGPPDAHAVAEAAGDDNHSHAALDTAAETAHLAYAGELQAETIAASADDGHFGEAGFIAAGAEAVAQAAHQEAAISAETAAVETVAVPFEAAASAEVTPEQAASIAALGFVNQGDAEPAGAQVASPSIEEPQAAVVEEASATAITTQAESQAVAPEFSREVVSSEVASDEIASAEVVSQEIGLENVAAQAQAELQAHAAEASTASEPETTQPQTAETALPAEAVTVEAAAVETVATDHAAIEEAPPVALAVGAGAGAGSAAVSEHEVPSAAQTEGQDSPPARWDDDEQPPDVAAAWARWRQIRDTLATPEFTSQVADAAAAQVVAAAEAGAQSAADFPASDFKDLRHTHPSGHKQSADEETEPRPQASAAAPAADSKVISSIVESVLAELKPRLVEEIARKLGNK